MKLVKRLRLFVRDVLVIDKLIDLEFNHVIPTSDYCIFIDDVEEEQS